MADPIDGQVVAGFAPGRLAGRVGVVFAAATLAILAPAVIGAAGAPIALALLVAWARLVTRRAAVRPIDVRVSCNAGSIRLDTASGESMTMHARDLRGGTMARRGERALCAFSFAGARALGPVVVTFRSHDAALACMRALGMDDGGAGEVILPLVPRENVRQHARLMVLVSMLSVAILVVAFRMAKPFFAMAPLAIVYGRLTSEQLRGRRRWGEAIGIVPAAIRFIEPDAPAESPVTYVGRQDEGVLVELAHGQERVYMPNDARAIADSELTTPLGEALVAIWRSRDSNRMA